MRNFACVRAPAAMARMLSIARMSSEFFRFQDLDGTRFGEL
jgi:hypothetical protein